MEILKQSIVLLFLLVIFSPTILAQTAAIDSLSKELQNRNEKDTLQVQLLNDLAFAYYRKDISKTMEYVTQAEAMAEAIGFKKGIAKSTFTRGVVEMVQSNFDKASEYFEQARQDYEVINAKKEVSNCHQAMGIVCDYQGKYEQSIANYERAIQINKELGLTKNIPANLSNIASVYSNMGKHSEAMINLKKALKLFKEKGDEHVKANCLNSMASIYGDQGNYPLSLENYNKSLLLYEEIGDSLGISGALNNIGNIYSRQPNNDKALEYFERSLAIQEKFENSMDIARIKGNIAGIYIDQEKYERAKVLLEEIMKISVELNDMIHVVNCLMNLGELSLKLKDYSKAQNYFTEAIKMNKDERHKPGLCKSYLGLAKAGFYKKKYDESLANALKANACAGENDFLKTKRDANNLLADIYQYTGDYKKAFSSHQQFKLLNDSLFNKENTRKIAELEYEYKYSRELDEAAIRELELAATVENTTQDLKKSQRNILWAIISFLLISILLGAIIFNQKFKNIKSQNQNILTEQRLLRSQMTPHFIFNSLATLQGMVLNREEKKSIAYLSGFSKLLRIVLENSRDKTVALAKEIAAIESYLALQNLEDEAYEYTVQIDDDIDGDLFKIPPMLIQPFVENAIEHAFVNQKENRKIGVQLSYLDKMLICTITDNGIGVDQQKAYKRKDKKSLATTITVQRLKLLSADFKLKGAIKIEDRKKYNEQGTVVTLTIPYKIDNE